MSVEILYQDRRVLVCLKPPGILSTNEPGGICDLLRRQLGDAQACLRTVHRLDQAVGGVMVLARSREAERRLSAQAASRSFQKTYLAVVDGSLSPASGIWRDLLTRDHAARRTLVADEPGRDVREAVLSYLVLEFQNSLSLIQIQLETGRTHQIRAQFSAHGFPLLGDGKYGGRMVCGVSLWSCSLAFDHPQTGERMQFHAAPPDLFPWNEFALLKKGSLP